MPLDKKENRLSLKKDEQEFKVHPTNSHCKIYYD